MHSPVLKDTWVSAHERNRVICQMYPQSPIAVVLADVDLPYWTLKVEHIAFCLPIRHATLTFDLLTLDSCPACRVTWPTLPPSLKTLRLFVHELRVITFPIDYHWKCVRGHCTCAESRDPWVGGQKQLHIWNPRPRFAYSLCNFYWATTTIKGRLLSSRPMLKPFSGAKILSCRNGAQKWRFWGKMRVETLDFGFETPKRHFLAWNHVVWRILRQNRCMRLGCSLSQEPKKIAVTLGVRNHACAEPKPLNRFG